MAIAIFDERMSSLFKVSRLEKFFNEVYSFPAYVSRGVTPATRIIENGDRFFHMIGGRNITDFDEIYVAAFHTVFSLYLSMKKINFNGIEDSPCHIILGKDGHEGFMNIIRRGNLPWWKILHDLGITDLTCPYMKKILAYIPEGKACEIPRVVSFHTIKEFRKLSLEQIKEISGMFDVKDLQVDPKAAIIATGAHVNIGLISVKETLHLYALVADYFLPKNRPIYIKPHPDDLIDYKNVFFDCKILPDRFPVEIISYFNIEDDILLIALGSSSFIFFKNHHALWVHPERVRNWLYTIHRQWAIKQVYDILCKMRKQKFYKGCVNESFTHTWKIEDVCENLNEEIRNDSLFIPVDGDVPFVSFNKEILLRNTYILLFYGNHKNLKEYIDLCSLPLLPKKIVIENNATNKNLDECIYILTNNQEYWDVIRNLHCEKHLKYSKEDVVMDIMTDEELEIAILQGKLEATEKRLKQVLEENDELRAQIESRNA